jgi:hypothetical protein
VIPSSIGPFVIVSFALLDTTLAGFRAAIGRDGRIDKTAYHRAALWLGFRVGLGVCAFMACLTGAVVFGGPDGPLVYDQLIVIGQHMLLPLGAFAFLVLTALALYLLTNTELRTLATVIILGPFTLARPFVIVLATFYGLWFSASFGASVLTATASLSVLLAERWLEARLARTVSWTHPTNEPSTDERAGENDEPAEFPIEESIDLHFFEPRDIPSVVEEYLWEGSQRGFTEVRLIHGRGKGIQRARVRKVLDRHAVVASYRSDGLGSTLALLRKPAPRRPRAIKSNEDRSRKTRER